MRYPQLRDGVGFVSLGDVTIVLDTAADRYWQFVGDTAFAIAWAAGERSGPASPSAIERLRGLSLLGDGPAEPGRSTRRVPTAERSALEEPGAPAGFKPLFAIEVIATALWLIVLLRRRPLATLLRSRCGTRAVGRGPSAADLARANVRYRRWLPAKPICLPDSLALRRMLARRGHRPDLVFGVSAYPFAAHCWLQMGDLVLDDALDHVHLFAAIHVA